MVKKVGVAVICGSGGDDLGFKTINKLYVNTKFGQPSSPLQIFDYGIGRVIIISRHGLDRSIPPHNINHRANIEALRTSNVEHVISLTSVGSLKKHLKPPSIMIPDDYINLWNPLSIFDHTIEHITPGLDQELRQTLLAAAKRIDMPVLDSGIYAQTIGPRLETKAEVRMLQNFADVVGMNMATEATLCKEAGLAYANISSIDNYANGIQKEELDFAEILDQAKANMDKVKKLVAAVLEDL